MGLELFSRVDMKPNPLTTKERPHWSFTTLRCKWTKPSA